LINQTAGFGLPPGINKLVCLLPLNGVLTLAGFVTCRFVLTDSLVTEVESWLANQTLYRALRDFRAGSNYDRLIFEKVDLHGERSVVTYNSFFVCMNPLDRSCLNFTASELTSNPFLSIGNILCTPSNSANMSLSQAATILFSIHIRHSDFFDLVICFGAKYLNVVGMEVQFGSLINSALACVFGNDNVNFGRENFVSLPPGNRQSRLSLAKRESVVNAPSAPDTLSGNTVGSKFDKALTLVKQVLKIATLLSDQKMKEIVPQLELLLTEKLLRSPKLAF